MTINKQNIWQMSVLSWLPLASVIVVLSAFSYLAVQQNYRMSANDPQIQIAEDISSALAAGKTAPELLVSPEPTEDLAASLSTFVVIYTATGTPVGATAALDGKLPTLPNGVLDFTKAHGEDRFTWQPKTGVRIAAVVSYYQGANPGFVLAGRSLKEVEERVNNLTKITALATAFSLVLSFLLVLLKVKMFAEPATVETQADSDSKNI